jgi:lipoprotein-anchoring transpeptidase ErfK/SrfK
VRRKVHLVLICALLALLAVAGVAYAIDRSNSDRIADGVTIGGVDVGGMTAAEARRAVQRELVDPLDKPVVVTYEGVKYKLNPRKLGVSADVKATVDRALEISREGSLPERVWRHVTGGEVDRSLKPKVTYNRDALDEFVERVAAEIDREPVDATIEPTPSSLNRVPSKPGRELERDKLREQLASAVRSPHKRTVVAQVRRLEPEVTTKELAKKYPVYLTVDRANFKLRLWKNLKLAKTYTVAIGAQGYDTPTGLYHIQNKAENPAWHVPNSDWAGKLAGKVIPGGAPNNPLKARWLGIYDGAGIHGTDDVGSLGSAASHGCVRMAVPDVIELYDQVPVGTPIYIG